MGSILAPQDNHLLMFARHEPEDRFHQATDEDFARELLSGERSRGMVFGRRTLGHLPTDPRCKLCSAPFRGPFTPLMRLIGKTPWPRNPRYCGTCLANMVKHRSGAEIEGSFLFADVRDSTTLAETMRPAEFRSAMDRFFHVASEALIDHDGIIDKFVGDEVIGIFVPLLTGERYADRAVAAGRQLLKATGHATGEPWLPVGGGVNTGVAYVGTVGDGEMVDLTAMGDAVNVAARLASAAGAGELLVSASTVAAAALSEEGLEHRSLSLKGKTQPVDVVVFGAS
jgi:adenylate cyclase